MKRTGVNVSCYEFSFDINAFLTTLKSFRHTYRPYYHSVSTIVEIIKVI